MFSSEQIGIKGWASRWVSTAAFTVLVAALILPVSAHEGKQRVFSSPEEAMKVFVETVQSGDLAGVLEILGPDGEDIVSSGDEVADRAARDRFLKAYEESVELVHDGDRVSVILGNDHWPFPIPIVKQGEGWAFDTESGREEVLNRRIGRNELHTIQTCLAYVDAQREYARTDRERDRIIQYAQKFFSDPGRRNGLYWETTEGELRSPLGPLVAEASSEGYKRSQDKHTPYHGYCFEILTEQGENAPGGAYSYLINGHMVAGFALVAWPAEYGVSGVMTFIVNQSGVVYEKDLGPETEEIAKAIARYDPDETWARAY